MEDIFKEIEKDIFHKIDEIDEWGFESPKSDEIDEWDFRWVKEIDHGG